MLLVTALTLGLVNGLALGFLLEKSRAFEPGMVVGQMQLRNLILVKVWFSAIATALIAVTLLHELGLVTLHPHPIHMAADIVGGLLVGTGVTLAGGCPAMIMVQIGAGYRDAWFVVLGGVAGSVTFLAVEPLLRPLLTGGPGPLTWCDILALPRPALAVALSVALFACIMAMERLRPWRLDLGPRADGVHHGPPSHGADPLRHHPIPASPGPEPHRAS